MKNLILIGLSTASIFFASSVFASDCKPDCYPVTFMASGTIIMHYSYSGNKPMCGSTSGEGTLDTNQSTSLCASTGTLISAHDDSIPDENKVKDMIENNGIEVHCGGTAPSGYCHIKSQD